MQVLSVPSVFGMTSVTLPCQFFDIVVRVIVSMVLCFVVVFVDSYCKQVVVNSDSNLRGLVPASSLHLH